MKKANVAIFVPHLGCPHACSFCNQREIAGQEEQPIPQTVVQTAGAALEALGERAKDAEIAFFGGSFTAIEPDVMESLLKAAQPFVGDGGFRGIRVSTRPDAIDASILATLRRYHVTAIELGAQSMDKHVLELNRRGHAPHDVVTASALIRAWGFELGLQMMTGLYGSTPETDFETARLLAELHPQTVRIYPTIVIEGTELAALYRRGEYRPAGLEETVSLCARLLVFFRKQKIQVIRLGLHATPTLSQSYVAGPWHPAFRELCEGEIYLQKAKAALQACKTVDIASKNVFLYVNPTEISKLAGQHRKNLTALESEFHRNLKIRPRALPVYTVEVEEAG